MAYAVLGTNDVGVYNFPNGYPENYEEWDDIKALHHLHLHCAGLYFDAMHAGLPTRIKENERGSQ